MTEQPHATLNRAADVLEERAGKATPGPWRTPPPDSVGEWIVYDADWAIAETRAYSHNDAEWTASMSPAVAAPLALWLRTDAKRCKYELAACSEAEAPSLFAEQEKRYAGALAFARMVLGEAT